ncbi:hypothetical protein DXG03_005885 [Asterophora parasitica]|uniref:Uncharacterized protein n=1 Tax=Asterophora parasitica TaxID=117018 RepID=A0A9P7KAR8_9AGAR|nr:hypothetical protein DXG03_005885 [Asterophora parasitica]
MDWARKRPQCPTCRHPTSDQCRIFLKFVEPSATKKPISVNEGLDLITKDTPAVSLKRAAQKIKKEAETGPKDVSRSLLESAKQLEHRLYPLASELAKERTANAALMTENASLKSLLEETSYTQSQILDLQRRLSEAEENQRSATSRAARKKEDNTRLNDSVKRHRRTLAKKDEELEALRAKLDANENEASSTITSQRGLH